MTWQFHLPNIYLFSCTIVILLTVSRGISMCEHYKYPIIIRRPSRVASHDLGWITVTLYCMESLQKTGKNYRVQNNLARITLLAPRRSSAEPLLSSLHWLPSELLQRRTSICTTRSSNMELLAAQIFVQNFHAGRSILHTYRLGHTTDGT